LLAHFIIVKLDVMEPNREIETPGGMDYLKKWEGCDSGLPFLVILNSAGKVRMGSGGYPTDPEEIADFVRMIKKTSKLTSGGAAWIEKWLRDHAPEE
jgi:hypothetical protein